MHTRQNDWMLIPVTILACLGFGMFPTATSGQSLEASCTENLHERLNAMDQKQWGLLVSKGREFMSNCLTVDGGVEAQATTLWQIGFGLRKQGKFEEAVPIFRRCATVKEFGDVVPILKRCVTINPDDANSWVSLGIALDQAGEPSDARKAYEKAISIGGYTEVNAAAIELARVCLSHPQTAATFRGHRLGESWRTFTRTEEGLCQIKTNRESCSEAASGGEAMLFQTEKDGSVVFSFEYGRFAHAQAFMTGSTFAELTYFEKTYGEPSNKFSHPEKGTAESYWHFSDGGEAHAEERKSKSGEFTIHFTILASDSALRPGSLAANPHTPLFNGQTLGESWQKFAQTGGGLCRVSKDNTEACKNAAAGKFDCLEQVEDGLEDGLIVARFTFDAGRLIQADLNTRVPKFVELDYLDKTYGHPYGPVNSPESGSTTRRWDYADGGQVSAIEIPNALGFLIMISAKTIPSQ